MISLKQNFKLVSVLLLTLFISMPNNANAQDKWGVLGDQLISDGISVGISVAAAVTGNVPLALGAGYISKYLSQYGVAGVKKLIELFQAYPPQDLGEINLTFVYLLHVKRNLYQTLISIRKSAAPDSANRFLAKELDKLQKMMLEKCKEGNCKPTAFDETMVNHSFLEIAMNANSSTEINNFLSIAEVKNTYQYLLLIYFDLLMVEQQLLQAQYQVLITQVEDIKEQLEENPYLSNAEKEYQLQLSINVALRWQLMMDKRRVILHKLLEQSIEKLQGESDALDQEIRGFKQ